MRALAQHFLKFANILLPLVAPPKKRLPLKKQNGTLRVWKSKTYNCLSTLSARGAFP